MSRDLSAMLLAAAVLGVAPDVDYGPANRHAPSRPNASKRRAQAKKKRKRKTAKKARRR